MSRQLQTATGRPEIRPFFAGLFDFDLRLKIRLRSIFGWVS